METSRKIGIEMEGYIDTHPSDVEIYGVRICKDGSLSNCEWSHSDEPFGVELKTDPMTELRGLYRTWDDMQSYGWEVDLEAGTHIHIDISDFSALEMVKLLRFGKGIERIIFMFVDEYRNGNDYCLPIHKEWRKMFRKNSKYKNIDWDALNDAEDVSEYFYNNYTPSDRRRARGNGAPWNGKYQWLNVLGSRYTTAEFRLFHAVNDIDDLVKQARMAEAIINFVKNTSMGQMEFVIKELYAQDSVENLITKFFEALGLDFEIKPIGGKAYTYLEEKLSKVDAEKTSDKLAKLMQA